MDDHARRAMQCGYDAFALTVDLDHYGRRERDLAKRFRTTARRRAAGPEFQMRFCWDDIKRLKDRFDIPLILKGIATAEDAEIACEHGIEAVYVSNHGGRQLDHGRGAVEVLPEVVKAVAGRAEVMVDGGVLRGADVVKAMILGADAVGIGRLTGYAIAAAGRAGLVRMLELLEHEILHLPRSARGEWLRGARRDLPASRPGGGRAACRERVPASRRGLLSREEHWQGN